MYQLLVSDQVHFTHTYDFDPSYHHSFDELKKISTPAANAAFIEFWQTTYKKNAEISLEIKTEKEETWKYYLVKRISYASWGGFRTGAWVLEPKNEEIVAGLVIGHGYGGRSEYNVSLTPANTVIILPVARGFHISASSIYPNVSSKHVLHGIEDKESYIIRGCVAELWSAVSCLYELYPQIKICSYSGASFGGGLGALMLPFEERIHKAHLSVPTFGNHPFRVSVPCTGSGESVRKYYQQHPEVLEKVLTFYDAATAASLIKIPMVITPALFDPSVPPPGQFSVANAITSNKQVYVFQTGHFDTKISIQEELLANSLLLDFFSQK